MSTIEIDATTTVGAFSVSSAFQAHGGITALFGPSGAGKSITLATIAGLLRPSSGDVRLHGKIVADPARQVHVPTQQRHIGMVFQQPALLAHRSPLDNVAIALRSGNRRTRRVLAAEWLDRVRAGHLADAPTATLSGGEQQRVALARALVHRPKVLLLDEPFSALDLPTRRSVRDLVRTLVDEQSITALIVTHDLEDLTDLADHVVLFEPGRSVGTHHLGSQSPQQLAQLLGLSSSGKPAQQ